MNFNLDNQQKSLSGSASNHTLAELLQQIKEVPKINVTVTKGYSVGYTDCDKQFKMDYSITFHDLNDEKWLIKPTSSIRSDRIYGNEFFAQNIKLVDNTVKKIYIVVPDSISEKEMKNKNDYSSKIHSGSYVSFLDDILTFSELRDLILSHASKNLSQGISSNILGNNAEDMIVNLLTNENNILIWNDYAKNNKTIKSATYQQFLEILLASGLTKRNNPNILEITATKNIPKLSNKGLPKTDVAFTVITDTEEITKTISVKNTNSQTVTIHEGDVSDVIIALRLRKESELSKALQQFQLYGSLQKLSEESTSDYDTLSRQLSSYNEALTNLFIFGLNSPLLTDPIQVADMILYTKNFEVISRENFVYSYIKKYAKKGQLGTPFKWTYPSKKRGQKIQIKGFTNNKK